VAFFQGIEVQSKLAQFVREVLPGARRLAWIAIPPDLVTVAGGEFRPEPYYQQIASRLGFELGYFECRKAEDFDAIFAAVNGWRAQAVIVEPAGLGWDARERIAQLAIRSGLPSFFTTHYNVAAGGLLSYAPDLMEVEYQSIGYVDRILRGARPADLPVEMPRKLELTINSKTAMALGLSIPRSLLLRADKVIE
jgi:putative ABC transport system substrate-binding protein